MLNLKTSLSAGLGLVVLLLVVLLLGGMPLAVAEDQDAPADQSFAIAGGKYKFTAPDGWVRKKPRTRIVEHEFEVPAAEGDKQPGRVTVMGAGGSIEANIERWYAQFTQPDGSATSEHATVDKLTIGGEEVQLVDISGTYLDKPTPFAAGVERENYRMLAGIVSAKKAGNYFVKFYGPVRTVTENEKAFREMIEGMKSK